jgi:hypothetical protein
MSQQQQEKEKEKVYFEQIRNSLKSLPYAVKCGDDIH